MSSRRNVELFFFLPPFGDETSRVSLWFQASCGFTGNGVSHAAAVMWRREERFLSVAKFYISECTPEWCGPCQGLTRQKPGSFEWKTKQTIGRVACNGNNLIVLFSIGVSHCHEGSLLHSCFSSSPHCCNLPKGNSSLHAAMFLERTSHIVSILSVPSWTLTF